MRLTQFAIAVLLAASTVRAADKRPPKLTDVPRGRYQMEVEDGVIYVLDTATGDVWSRRFAHGWVHEGNPAAAKTAKPKTATEAAGPATLELPEKKVTLTIKQRESKAIPGSDERVRLAIDDITGGQVLVSVVDDEGRLLLDETSMSPGDIVRFKVGKTAHFVRVKELKNFLTGTDIAILEVAADRKTLAPKKKKKAKKRKRDGKAKNKKKNGKTAPTDGPTR